MKLENVIVGCIKRKKPEERYFDIYVTKTYMDGFGKRYVENKLWDTVSKTDLDHQISMAEKLNGLKYKCNCNLCV